jgi:adenylate kinase
MKIVIVTGPPYSGKGTQCEIVSQRMHYTHLSTGDRCRQEKELRTGIGQIMSRYEEKGDLVPDSIMKTLFGQILDENKQRGGILLDGFPRTRPQVDDLLELVAARNMEIFLVLNIEVPREELLSRAMKRATSSSREDDRNPETHLKRVRIFEEQTFPAIEYMKTRIPVVNIDGIGSVEEITRRIIETVSTHF